MKRFVGITYGWRCLLGVVGMGVGRLQNWAALSRMCASHNLPSGVGIRTR